MEELKRVLIDGITSQLVVGETYIKENIHAKADISVAASKYIARACVKPAIAVTATVALIVTGCNAQVEPTPTTPFSGPTSVIELNQDDLEMAFLQQGPEATPETTTSVYPQSLTVEEIGESLNRGGGFPTGFPSAGVNEMLDTRNKWFQNLGMSGVTGQLVPNGKSGADFRWAIKPVDTNGNLAGWLQVRDENVEGGWRYAEKPTWEPTDFDPATDEFRFILPEKQDFLNTFELIPYGDEYWVLVEVDKNGQPVRYLDTVSQEMKWVVGAENYAEKEAEFILDLSPELIDQMHTIEGYRDIVSYKGRSQTIIDAMGITDPAQMELYKTYFDGDWDGEISTVNIVGLGANTRIPPGGGSEYAVHSAVGIFYGFVPIEGIPQNAKDDANNYDIEPYPGYWILQVIPGDYTPEEKPDAFLAVKAGMHTYAGRYNATGFTAATFYENTNGLRLNTDGMYRRASAESFATKAMDAWKFYELNEAFGLESRNSIIVIVGNPSDPGNFSAAHIRIVLTEIPGEDILSIYGAEIGK